MKLSKWMVVAAWTAGLGCSGSGSDSSTSSSTSAGSTGGASTSTGSTGSTSASSSSGGSTGGGCTLTANTTPTATVSASGCAVLTRDSSSCLASRQAAGLSGFWLKFSCRVTLTKSGSLITAASDGLPDYESNYFAATDACHETYTAAIQNPNVIATQAFSIGFPTAPDTTSHPMGGAGFPGLALNGVAIYGDFAAPGDDIFLEAQTFDRCAAHPQGQGQYHYHCEPFSISQDDSAFIGVMRDGYPIYGRRDPDGSLPTLDSQGGHTGVTVDSPSAATYHYHVNEQTSVGSRTAGQKQWFLTSGTFHGTPAACTGCQ